MGIQLYMVLIKKTTYLSQKNGYYFLILRTKIRCKTIFKIKIGAVHQKVHLFLCLFITISYYPFY